jgi:hypothetical protein
MTSEMLLIVPTRGRPFAANDLIMTLHETCRAQTTVLFGVDSDDESLPAYLDVFSTYRKMGLRVEHAEFAPRLGLVGTLNFIALEAAHRSESPFAVAFMGDDHRPRTVGWDAAYIHALELMGTGIVYGNDLLQGGNLPTQVAITTDIIRALEYMVPPALQHMYADNFWRDLGSTVGCLQYLSDVIVEHMHPLAGKGEPDEHYDRVNGLMGQDGEAYARYRESGDFNADVEIVKGLIK